MSKPLKYHFPPGTSSGFTLVEILVSLIIITVFSSAVMMGVTQVQQLVYKISVRERAYDELVNYTEFWKAKIAANQIPTNIGSDDEKEVVLFYQEDGITAISTATLRRSNFQNRTNPPQSSARHYRFKTEVEWHDIFGNKSIEPLIFVVDQLVFL
ncbi:MAG: prepilin-type N-terminal cleavage/methylation domain-containing protein [Candidatus Marinimicrobia bacterium]|nr:prepilin-type N-terminal cleavage/methylation domain-containing protein [Candidatus Neomarinimicrobiota bacterium]MBT3634078.1 prepilin-type N-terminal cleavage/methylation domain-containing protein [Candidatus Neomarinimicrobiota bacterium]MBT3683048.1 prepilin-type N-terminal cleavage/methylation domain-containing protein [Candidatus Neomarinimicrobiota bacterium]MBT3759860.1 prepilin-type N-terminal cleavage/methylation domain-containing protein [Candidatus Neomarinimicrobiota bacterium]M